MRNNWSKGIKQTSTIKSDTQLGFGDYIKSESCENILN